MRHFLLTFAILLSFQLSVANQSWQYKKTRDGITMIASGGYEDSIGNHKMYDDFFDLLVKKTKQYRKGIKVLLLLDQSFIKTSYHQWFAAISYDTLRKEDREFIEAYNYYRIPTYRNGIRSNLPSEKYKIDLPEPIDINSTFHSSQSEIGLKIIYEYGINDSISFFDRVYTLTKYGLEHINEIKTGQSRIVMPCSFNRINVSLLTIDTNKIQAIPLIKLKDGNSSNKGTTPKFIYIFIGILIITFFFFVRYKTNNKKNI